MWISKNTKPFTDEQKSLFDRYRHYASKVAAKFLDRGADGGAEFCDDMKAAAMLGLLLAAQRYDPSRDGPFGNFARMRIVGTMVERTYENATGAHGAERHDRRLRNYESYAQERGDGESWGDYADVDLRDELDSVLCYLSGRHRRVVRKFYAGMECKDIAAEEWCSKAYAHDMVKDGIARARYAAAFKLRRAV